MIIKRLRIIPYLDRHNQPVLNKTIDEFGGYVIWTPELQEVVDAHEYVMNIASFMKDLHMCEDIHAIALRIHEMEAILNRIESEKV